MPWRGAIEFSGFPVNVALHPQKKSSRGPGFKNLAATNNQPPVGKQFDTDGNELTSDQIVKGVQVGRGKAAVIHRVSDEAVEQIKAASEQSVVVEPDTFVPVSEIPLEQALMSYVVTPDENVPGADRSANIVWNGLRSTGLAYVTQATLSSRDAILAIWATDTHMRAVTLPFVAEMYPDPAYDGWKEDEKAATMFGQVVENVYEVGSFERGKYASEYAAKRDAVIADVLAGVEIVAPEPPQPSDDAPDLMAALEAQLAVKGKGKVAADAPKVERKRKTPAKKAA